MSDQDQAGSSPRAPALTERQRSVFERIERRMSIKMIAQEMGVSETRINQLIRALKDIYQVQSLNELAEIYRREQGGNIRTRGAEGKAVNIVEAGDTPARTGLEVLGEQGEVAANRIYGQDSIAMRQADETLRPAPGLLEGNHGILLRVALIVGIALGTLATFVLMVTAAMSLGEIIGGSSQAPSQDQTPAH